MSDLSKKAWIGIAQFFIATCALIFIPAWTFHYGQAWLFLVAFFIPVIAITLYLMEKDKKLLERRLIAGPGGEKSKIQKTIQSIASLAFIAVFLVSSFDHRFAWSFVPPYISLLGDVLVSLGLFIVYLVFRANTYTSATIEIAPEQTVISTGPYALVRHPMYTGALIMLIGVPLSLGSYGGLIPVAILAAVIIWRLIDEEKFLAKDLPGYTDYQTKTRSRLIPYIW
jgi:protein-S-isoprenylcysteine O-methyltransferase Ste14